MLLLERDLHLKALRSALSEADDEGRVALVYGEAGIGKTSLVEHFIKENKNSWRLLQGACDSLFTPRPLGPLYDIASQIQRNLPMLLRAETNRGVIFSACLNELKTQRTILLIEDIHWADEATLDLLKYLGRRIRQTTSLMVITYRDDEIGVDHPLRLLLGDLASSNALHRIPVSSLTNEAVREMAKDKNIDPITLHDMTNGNPFFITEVLAAESGIPETVRDAVLARAARLSLSARSVLETAAVIGSRSESWLLSKIIGAESSYVEECTSKGMLQTQGDYYAFRHELARQTILESISPQRKMSLHRMILNKLTEAPEAYNDYARLANHAAGTKDGEAVLEFAPAAARQASSLGAHRQAAVHYKTALQYMGMVPLEVRAELLDSYSDECSLLDQQTEAKQAQQDALLIWRQLGQREKEGRAYRRLSEIEHKFILSQEREQNILHAIELLETLPPSKELARAYSQMASLHLRLNKASGRDPIYWGTRAMELAEQLGDEETLVHALNTLGTWKIMIGRNTEGQVQLERSLQLSLDHGLPVHAALALYSLFNRKSPNEVSHQYGMMGIEYCIQHDLDQLHISFLVARANIRFLQGEWDEAYHDIQSVLNRTSDKTSVGIRARAILFQLMARRGEPISPDIIGAMRVWNSESYFIPAKCAFAARFAELAWLRGDLVQCRAEAEATFQMASQHYDLPYASDDFGELSYWMWRVGDIKEPPANIPETYSAQIRGDWRTAAQMWEKIGCPYEQAMALMDGDEAAQLAALEIFERLGARPAMKILKQKMRSEGIRIPRGPRPATRENPFGLTAREMDVLGSLVKGQSNNAIAQQLSLSTRTVEYHIASILQKMGVQSRNEAVALALKHSLLLSE